MRQADRKSPLAATALTAGFALVLALAGSTAASAGDLTRTIRLKLSAGDLRSGEAALEDWKREHGEDGEYLDGLAWLARGAELLGQDDLAMTYVGEVRRRIPAESETNANALGAAIEVESRVKLTREGRGAALRFLEQALAGAHDVALRSRIAKNIDLIALEGSPAPEIAFPAHLGPAPTALADLRGRPVLLFFWAHWCGDCKAQAPVVARLAAKYRGRGLAVLAPTRLYGTGKEGAEATPQAETARIAEVLAESYAGFDAIPVPIDEASMVRYGASATPTFVLIDRNGRVRLYTPTRMSEADLERRIEALLAEPAE
jgi:thiol-disulfide isomerase/thioredoxin